MEARRSAVRKGLVCAGFVLAFVYAFPYFEAMHSANEMPRLYLTEEMVDRGTFRLDARWAELSRGSTFDVATTPDGHHYSNKAPGASFVAVPAYLAVKAWHRLAGGAASVAEVTWACRFAAAILPTLLFLPIFLGLPRRFAPPAAADGALVALAFGSMVYPYALLFFSHALATASAGGAFAVAVGLVRGEARRPRAAGIGVGFLGGLAVLADYQAVIALAGVAVYLAWRSRHRLRDLGLVVVGGVPPAVALGVYQWACFGAPWRTGYAFAADPAHKLGVLGVIGPNAQAMAQALVTPDNGLLVLMPWVLLAVVGAVALLRAGELRAEAAIAVGVALAYVLFVGSLVPEFGRAGWSVGPRYITCALPFLGWLAAAGLGAADGRPWTRAAAQALVLTGVVIMVAAGTTFPHWPTTFGNPLYEVSFWLLGHGRAPHSLGTLVGLRGVPSLLPLYAVVAALVVALLGRGERGRLATLALAAAGAALLVAALGLVPHPGARGADRLHRGDLGATVTETPRAAVGVSLFYVGYFGALGLYWPYFGPFLRELGLGSGAATQVLALAPLCGLIAPPLVGMLADWRRSRAGLLRLLSAGAAVAFLGFLAVRGAAVIVVALAFAACRAPLVALADASAVDAARADGASYGRIRAWGSLAFLVAAAGGGELAARVGLRAVFAAAAIALVGAAAATLRVQAPPPLERGPATISVRRLAPFLAAAALAGLANGAYDAGFSLHLEQIGLGGRFVGWAWALGVVSEVGVMAVSGRLVARFGAEPLFALALATGAARWAATAFVRAPLAILALQPLHGITFGLFWAAGVATAHHRAGRDAPTAAQGLFGASVSAGSTVGMALAGSVLEAGGGRTLYLGAAVAAAAAAAIASRLRA